MTYKRQGLTAEANRLVAGCRKRLGELSGNAGAPGPGWHDHLACEMFCREAEALLDGPLIERAPSPRTENVTP